MFSYPVQPCPIEYFDPFIHRFREQFAGKRINLDDLFTPYLPDGDIDLLGINRDIFLFRFEDLLFVEDRIAFLLLDAHFLGKPVDQFIDNSFCCLIFPDMGIRNFSTPGISVSSTNLSSRSIFIPLIALIAPHPSASKGMRRSL